MNGEARAELVAAAKRLKKYHDDGFIRSEFRGDMYTILDSILLVDGAPRKPEAAPSDTDRDVLRWALRNVLTGASVQGDSERGADAVIAAGFSRSQPVQVEVTDDMVEKAAEAMWDRWGHPGMFKHAPTHRQDSFRADARAALTAALGGGDQC